MRRVVITGMGSLSALGVTVRSCFDNLIAGHSGICPHPTHYVMADEARHVAFGQHLLKDHLSQLSAYEKKERHDFLLEGIKKLKTGIVIPGIDGFYLSAEEWQFCTFFQEKVASKFKMKIHDLLLT